MVNWKPSTLMVLTAANAYFAHYTHTTHKQNQKHTKHLLTRIKNGEIDKINKKDLEITTEYFIENLFKFI